MLILITGGSGSGKSRLAEELVLDLGLPRRIYAATMEVWGQEGQRKVERHRQMRQGKGFTTLECPRDLADRRIPAPAEQTAVLLECVMNLTANEMFRPDLPKDPGTIQERILKGIHHLEEQCACLVAVTGQVGEDGVQYDPETMEYIRLLGRINQELAKEASQVYEAAAGILVKLKGENL